MELRYFASLEFVVTPKPAVCVQCDAVQCGRERFMTVQEHFGKRNAVSPLQGNGWDSLVSHSRYAGVLILLQ